MMFFLVNSGGNVSPSNPAPTLPDNWVLSTDYASLALAVATGKHVLIPANTTHTIATTSNTAPAYSIGGLASIALGEKQILMGADRFTSKIVVTGPGGGVEISSDYAQIHNLTFEGPGMNSGNIFSRGIVTWAIGWEITNCRFSGFSGETGGGGYGGGAIMCIGKGAPTNKKDGALIDNVWCTYNKTGLNIVEQAEFLQIGGKSTFKYNHTGISNQGGNNKFNMINIVENTIGFKLYGGYNHGHGSMSDCMVNHNVTNLDIADQELGFDFNGDFFYDGHIKIKNSNIINFNGGHLPGGAGNEMILENNVAGGVKVSAMTYYVPSGYTKTVLGGSNGANDLVVV